MRNALLTLTLLAVAAPAFAQEGPPRWTFGAMVADRDAPYRGLDEGLLFVPLVRFEGERAYLRGLRGGWRLVDDEGFEFALIAQARLDGYKAEDSDFLAGMDDRKFSLDLGAAATFTSKKLGALDLAVVADTFDRSGGYEATAAWNVLFKAGGWTVIPGALLRWQSSDVVDYYFGVRPDEALPGRPAYSGDSALTPELSVLVSRPLSERWTLFARAGQAWLPSEISNSPIVADDSSTSLFVAIGYSPR